MKKMHGMLAVGSLFAFGGYLFCFRPWHLRWGTNVEEAGAPLPGDELVPEPRVDATHALTILAKPDRVWPWLVQIGQGRGGFYSYDWIENLMGLGIKSADRIVPEFQRLQAGDILPLAPGGFGPKVVATEPGRYLLLHGDSRAGGAGAPVLKPGDYMNVSWLFFLSDRGDGTTRLIERFKADYNPTPLNTLFYRAILEPGSFIMERKMLLGIKKRAEAASERD